MNLSRSLCSLTLSILLTACGGGGGDNDSAPDTPQALVHLADFEGTWLVRPENADCQDNFAYNAPYFYRFRSLTIVETDGMLRATVAVDVFDDATCSTRRGVVEEQFLIDTLAGTSAGRSNVTRATFSFIGSRFGADGGAGLGMTTIPDGSLSDLLNQKFLMDREGERLYFTSGSNGAAMDSTGHPTVFDADDYLVR